MRRTRKHIGRGPLGALLPSIVGMALLVGGSRTGSAQDLEGIGERPAVTLGGNVSARLVGYGSDGTTPHRSPFSYVLSGTVDVNLYDLELPFTFTFSEQNRNISQPFNQFGVSPHYKWITAHLGYRNLNFSPYTLAGHQIFGGGVELNPGDFRLGFVAGEFNRAVEEDTTKLAQIPAYQRTGFSGRVGYGSDANHVDLIVLKAQDNSKSLEREPILGDVRPAENLVLGASARTTIGGVVSLYGDFAVSDYTRDVRSETIALDDAASTLGEVIPPRTSTQIYTALTGGLSFNIGTFTLGATYSRIDPDYRSMGAYYLANDIESIVVTPSVSLLESTLYLNGSFSLQHDNIQGKKRATTQRIAPSLAINYAPEGRFGLSVQASDLLTSQEAGTEPLNDSVRMEQQTPTVTITPRYVIDDSIATHSFSGSLSYQGLLDRNALTAMYSEYTSLGADISYVLALPPSGLTFNASVMTNRFQSVGGTFTTSGFALGAGATLDENRVSLDGTFGMSFQEAGTTINAGAGGGYRINEHHNIDLDLSLTASSTSESMGRSFHEYITVLSYAYTF